MQQHLGLFLGLASSDWAAWTQAVGTIGAVCGAFAIHVSRSVADRKEQISNILAVVKATEEFATTIQVAFAGPGGSALEVALIEAHDDIVIAAFVRALNAIPVHNVGVPAGVVALLSLRIQMEILGKEIATFRAHPAKDGSPVAAVAVSKALAKITEDCTAIHRALDS